MIPQLRFPEFVDDWSSEKLGYIGNFSKGKGISKADVDDNGSIECIRYGELYTVYSEVITAIVSKTNLDENELVLSDENDVIIPASGETHIDIATASCVAISGVALGGDLNIIKSKINGVFLSYYLNNARKKNIARLAQGISVVHLYASQLASLTVNIPTQSEQIKIANFLTAIDERINLLQKKKTELERYKKGATQKLFSQEIRFKQDDGNDFPDWEDKKLGEVADIKRGAGSQYIKYSTNNDNSIRLIRIGDFLGGEPVFVVNSKEIQRFFLKKGDILIAGTGATAGITFKVPDEFVGMAYSYNAPKIKIKNQLVLFFMYLLKSDSILKQQKRLFTGNAQPFLDTYAIKNFKIILPSKDEQQKIANFLSSIDEAIEKLENQIEQSQNWKQGLLQKMFV